MRQGRRAGRRVTLGGFAVAITLLAATGIVTYRSITEFASEVGWENHTYEVLAAASRFRADIRTAESSARGYALSGEPVVAVTYSRAAREAQAALEEMRELTTDNPAQQAALDSLAVLVDQKLAVMGRLVTGANPSAVTRELFVKGEGRRLIDSIELRTARLAASERDLLDSRERNAESSARVATAAVVVGGMFGILLVLAAARANWLEIGEREEAESRLAQEAERQAVIIEVQQAVATAPIASDELMHLIAEQAMYLFRGDGAAIALAEGPAVVFRTMVGILAPHTDLQIPMEGSMVGQVYHTGQPMLVQDTETDGRAYLESTRQVGFRSAVALPLQRSDEIIGVLTVVGREPSAFGDDEFRGLKILAGLLSAAFTNAAAFEANQRLLEELRRNRDAAEIANQAKSQFLATMSHELRTPLNSVIGFAKLLQRNSAGTMGPQDLQFLSRIEQNGIHLLQLINDILDLSKIEAGKVEADLTRTDLLALVRETVLQLGGQARGQEVELRAELPPTAEMILTDAARLRQVLINLIANALKFTERGHVTVRVVNLPGTRHPARLEVQDTGIGIPKERQAAIFEAFLQADSTTERKYGGTGLGLTISRSLLELMGASLTVTSEPGRGSTFTILFPEPATLLPEAAPAPPVLPATGPSGQLPGRPLVLVIDDDPDARLLLQHLLTDAGFEVAVANGGREGLYLARERRPAIITLDLMMPGMSGWEVLQSLKADPVLGPIPVVIVSVVAGEQEGRLFGVMDLIPKPVDRDRLVTTVHRLLLEGPRHVLIVEDDAHQRRLLSTIMDGEDYTVDTARHGVEAFERMERRTPDLILLDLAMPVMDGQTFLAALRNDPRFTTIPVVVVTGELTSEDAKRLQREALGIVRKGLDFERSLKDVLERVRPPGPA